MGYLADFSNLFFPSYCAGCGNMLYKNEDSICIKCLAALPRTHLHDERNNKLEKLFWGRTDVKSASVFLRMPKRGLVHRLMHELKYHNNPELGERLGHLFGVDLAGSASMNTFDAVLPVPLHPRKELQRGYNQSACIASGIHEPLKAALSTGNLIRELHTSSQTRKSRYERWENVSEIFTVVKPELLEGKHVLLIDDVITTGSTIEGCAIALNQIPGLVLSVAALAMPVH